VTPTRYTTTTTASMPENPMRNRGEHHIRAAIPGTDGCQRLTCANNVL
jgi:hypothetical protein